MSILAHSFIIDIIMKGNWTSPSAHSFIIAIIMTGTLPPSLHLKLFWSQTNLRKNCILIITNIEWLASCSPYHIYTVTIPWPSWSIMTIFVSGCILNIICFARRDVLQLYNIAQFSKITYLIHTKHLIANNTLIYFVLFLSTIFWKETLWHVMQVKISHL